MTRPDDAGDVLPYVPLPYVPLDGRPWRLTMGLRPLDPTRWLDVDQRRFDELRLKQSLLTHHPERVTAALPGSEAPGAELLEAVVSWLGLHHPGLVATEPDGRIIERSTGVAIDAATLHPVDAAARLVQEDLCLMTRQDDVWVLAAASVCFPSHWQLADKIGRDLLAIHEPVPGYEASLDRPVRGFFDRLTPPRPMWRLNWTLIDSPDLHQPDEGDRRRARVDVDRPATALWFRVERQTLRRLDTHAAIVFTIRTYVAPLEELVASHPEVVPALRSTLPTIPVETLRYKGLDAIVGPLGAWLDARGDGRR